MLILYIEHYNLPFYDLEPSYLLDSAYLWAKKLN